MLIQVWRGRPRPRFVSEKIFCFLCFPLCKTEDVILNGGKDPRTRIIPGVEGSLSPSRYDRR